MTYWVIVVQGHLDRSWSAELGGLRMTHEAEGVTRLSGPLPDQAALFGVLLQLFHLSIPLVAVQQSASDDCPRVCRVDWTDS
jgi:hypothetical protein